MVKCYCIVKFVYVVRCAIWYHLYNLKNVKNTHGGVLILVKLQAVACNFTKINTPPWVFFTFLKLYKWCQIAQRTTYVYQVTPSLTWMGIFFLFQNCFYIKLLMIIFIRMFGIQYWKCNNICSTWKIKGKLKIVMWYTC